MNRLIDNSLTIQETGTELVNKLIDHRAVILSFEPKLMTTQQVTNVFASIADLLLEVERHQAKITSHFLDLTLEAAKIQTGGAGPQ